MGFTNKCKHWNVKHLEKEEVWLCECGEIFKSDPTLWEDDYDYDYEPVAQSAERSGGVPKGGMPPPTCSTSSERSEVRILPGSPKEKN